MNKVFLLLGSNLGDRKDLLQQAVNKIKQEVGEIIAISSLYESEPWGFESEYNFLNQVVIINTKLSPEEVLNTILNIENQLGRIRNKNIKGYQSRVIDIDILFYNNLIINTDTLIIPHPRLHLRKFTLLPLVEITPDFIHPILKQSLEILLLNCVDENKTWKMGV